MPSSLELGVYKVGQDVQFIKRYSSLSLCSAIFSMFLSTLKSVTPWSQDGSYSVQSRKEECEFKRNLPETLSLISGSAQQSSNADSLFRIGP